jgi:hypothetical protein
MFLRIYRTAKYSSTNQKSVTEASGSQILKDSENEEIDEIDDD